MKFCNAAKSLYLDTDAFGISLRAGLFLVKDDMNCGHDELLDNALIPHQIALPAKAYLVLSGTTVTHNARILGFYIGKKNFVNTVL